MLYHTNTLRSKVDDLDNSERKNQPFPVLEKINEVGSSQLIIIQRFSPCLKNLYIAGPGVFFPDAVQHRDRKKELCSQYGFIGLSPLDYELQSNSDNPFVFSQEIFQANIELMNTADVIIADLTPFRGSSADAGTVLEIGYMHALGKPTYGYSNSETTYLERVNHGSPSDLNSHRIEDFGLNDNLMLIHSCTFFTSKATSQPYFDIDGFETCLKKLKNF